MHNRAAIANKFLQGKTTGIENQPRLKNFKQNLILTCNMFACLKPCFSIVAACWAGRFAK